MTLYCPKSRHVQYVHQEALQQEEEKTAKTKKVSERFVHLGGHIAPYKNASVL